MRIHYIFESGPVTGSVCCILANNSLVIESVFNKPGDISFSFTLSKNDTFWFKEKDFIVGCLGAAEFWELFLHINSSKKYF